MDKDPMTRVLSNLLSTKFKGDRKEFFFSPSARMGKEKILGTRLPLALCLGGILCLKSCLLILN